MDKSEFIERFATSKSTKERNESAAKASMWMVKFYYDQEIPSLDFCEICVHPKGRTLNTFEMWMSSDAIDPKTVKDFKDRSKQYHTEEYGKDTRIILNIVIPPEPKMIMEIGEHLDALKELGIVITVYDPKRDKRGSCPVNDGFLDSLREDEDFKGMSDSEIFQNFMMNFVEML